MLNAVSLGPIPDDADSVDASSIIAIVSTECVSPADANIEAEPHAVSPTESSEHLVVIEPGECGVNPASDDTTLPTDEPVLAHAIDTNQIWRFFSEATDETYVNLVGQF